MGKPAPTPSAMSTTHGNGPSTPSGSARMPVAPTTDIPTAVSVQVSQRWCRSASAGKASAAGIWPRLNRLSSSAAREVLSPRSS